jgi:hypothetical protein
MTERWEYRYWRGTGRAVVITMNQWGEEGWELICVTGGGLFSLFEHELWFKRQADGEKEGQK